MLELVLPNSVAVRIAEALRAAGDKEVGGILMAEHVSHNRFVVRDLTIQRRGLIASFVRNVRDAWTGLRKFFKRTNKDFKRFNYVGEWHSHPLFSPWPSATDRSTMRELAMDASIGANFLVLLIVKLEASSQLVGTVHTYLPDGAEHMSELVVEES